MNTYFKYTITKWYYLITPLFIIADYGFDKNIRVSVFDAYPLYKNIYYAFCVVCGIGVLVWPICTPVVALCESVINIVITVLGILLPYILVVMHADDILNAELDMFDMYRSINLIMAGGIALLAFKQSSRDVESMIQERLSKATEQYKSDSQDDL